MPNHAAGLLVVPTADRSGLALMDQMQVRIVRQVLIVQVLTVELIRGAPTPPMDGPGIAAVHRLVQPVVVVEQIAYSTTVVDIILPAPAPLPLRPPLLRAMKARVPGGRRAAPAERRELAPVPKSDIPALAPIPTVPLASANKTMPVDPARH